MDPTQQQQINQDKMQFMQGMQKTLLGQSVSPQEIEGLAFDMPATIDEALVVIEQLRLENEALKQQLGVQGQPPTAQVE